jgi:hypothetical protein
MLIWNEVEYQGLKQHLAINLPKPCHQIFHNQFVLNFTKQLQALLNLQNLKEKISKVSW